MQPSVDNKLPSPEPSTISTLDDWLSHSIPAPMASTSEGYQTDDNVSSLGDSSYDFLEEGSTATTDDEGSANMTMSFSSSGETDSGEPEPETPLLHRSLDSVRAGSGPEEARADVAEEDNESDVSDKDSGTIFLEESSNTSSGSPRCFEGSHVLKELHGRDIAHVLPGVSEIALPRQLSLSVKQTMTGRTFVPDGLFRPFRLLYVGDTSGQDVIIQKIGSALAASSANLTPRFNILPVSSFGNSEPHSPQVELIHSVGLEMSVQECVSASFYRKEDGNDSICLSLPDGMRVVSTWSSADSCFDVTEETVDWRQNPPHMAVFYLSDNDSMAAKSTQRFARSFMSRHRIPCLILTQSQLSTAREDEITLDYMSPHLCLEPRINKQGRPGVIRRLPLDLTTFLELDARQLNRNIACLVKTHVAGGQKQTVGSYMAHRKQDVIITRESKEEDGALSIAWLALKRYFDSHSFSLFFTIAITTVLSTILLGVVSVKYQDGVPLIPSSSYQRGNDGHQPPVIPKLSMSAPTTTATPGVPTLVATTTSSTSALIPNPSPKTKLAGSSNTDLASFLLDSHTLTPNNSAQFKVHVVGDCHVVLRPPIWFTRYRKAPKLLFRITRQNQNVEHELLKLFDGVYALKVPREEAYGTVNVSVHTTSKPRINETFQVAFGNTWLKAAGWRKAASEVSKSLRNDLDQVQNGLSNVFAQTSSGVQVVVHDAVRKADSVRRDMERVRSSSVNRTLRTTDLILAQTRDLSLRLSSQVINSTSALSTQMTLYNDHVRKDVALYIAHKKAAMKRGARSISRSTSKVDLKRLAKTANSVRASKLRAAQKSVYKKWLKIRGVPKVGPKTPSEAAHNIRRTSKKSKIKASR